MVIKLFSTAFVVYLSVSATWAETSRRVSDLLDAMSIPDLIAVMRVEGQDYGVEISRDLLAGRGGDLWQKDVDKIYDTDRMRDEVEEQMAACLPAEDLPAILGYFAGGLGPKVATLEMEARRTLLSHRWRER